MRFSWILGLLMSYPALGCDFCGCSPSSATWDQSANNPSSYIQFTPFFKAVKFSDPASDLQKSYLAGSLLRVAYSPAKQLEISAQMPVMFLSNHFSKNKQNSPGNGDLQLIFQARIFQKLPGTEQKTGHSLIVNGGVELPTGSYTVSEDPLLSNIAFGSKSYDLIAGAAYKLSVFKWALVSGGNVKINTENKEDMKFGNQYVLFAQGSYNFMKKSVMWQPMAGLRYEHSDRNIYRNINQNKTGGNVMQFTAGISGGIKKWGWGVQLMQPLWQNNGGGIFRHSPSAYLSFQYQFKKW